MNQQDVMNRAQYNYDSRMPAEDPPEPTEEQFDAAFLELVGDHSLLLEYIDTACPGSFLEGYREWLGSRLADRAEAIRLKDIQRAKDEAAEDIAENRYEDAHLNGGW